MAEKLVRAQQQEGPPQEQVFSGSSAHPIITQPIEFQAAAAAGLHF